MTLTVLGVRHHGPGSARSVIRALDMVNPSAVVIEGPPELDAVVHLAADPAMRLPVAGLVYDVNSPRRASFYPLAVFSPEWVALQWALSHGATVRFADLPASNRLAEPIIEMGADADDHALPPEPRHEPIDEHIDPIGAMAAAAGYDDAERWWEDAIEQRSMDSDVLDRFESVRLAMREFRAGIDDDDLRRDQLFEREAAMRKVLRKVVKETDGPVVMVCGAFHAPVLGRDDWPAVSADNALLKGLPKTKVAATWAPWTSGRLAFASGYGAGVQAPRWYEHLFSVSDDIVAHWMVDAARLLRSEGYDASAASAVEATRLAEALAAVRGRPVPGLAEVNDAAATVLANGSTLALNSIAAQLLVGSTLGAVPDDTPMVPLAEDLARQQRSLRPQAEGRAEDGHA